MPRVSKRRQLLAKLRSRLSLKKHWGWMRWRVNKQLPSLTELLVRRRLAEKISLLESKRHVSRGQHRDRMATATKEFQEDLNDGQGCWLHPHEFKAKHGMDRASFWSLHNRIKDHDAFKSQEPRGRKQLEPECQLLMLLAFLRTEGDGMSNQHGRTSFHIGYGSVDKCKDRAVTAILDTLRE